MYYVPFVQGGSFFVIQMDEFTIKMNELKLNNIFGWKKSMIFSFNFVSSALKCCINNVTNSKQWLMAESVM